MDILFLTKKGLKIRKKRLAGGGGGGGGGSLIGNKLTVINSKAPTNAANIGLSVIDTTNGGFVTVSNSGGNHMLRRRRVDDSVANLNGIFNYNGNGTALPNGTLTLSSANDYVLLFDGSIASNATSTSNEILETSVIHNTANATIIPNQMQDLIFYNSPFGHQVATVEFEITNLSAGVIIVKVNVVGGGTDTDANVIAQTAQISDAYYLVINVT